MAQTAAAVTIPANPMTFRLDRISFAILLNEDLHTQEQVLGCLLAGTCDPGFVYDV